MSKPESPRWEQEPSDKRACQGPRTVCVRVLASKCIKQEIENWTIAQRLAVGGRPGKARADLRQAVEDLAARQTLCEGLDGVLAIQEDDRIACLRRCAPRLKVFCSLIGCEVPE